MQFNDQDQTIMGKKIPGKACYQACQDALLFNVFEGWQPTARDCHILADSFYQPQGPTMAYLKQVYGKEFGHE